MRSISCAILLSIAVLAVDRPDVFSIDCASGRPDPAVTSAPARTTDGCASDCKASCASADTEAKMEGCLASETIDGCIFDLSKVHDVDTESCVTKPTTSAGPTLVLTIKQEDIEAFGDGKSVESAMVVGELKNPTNVARCTKKNVALGVATSATTEKDKCAFIGTSLGSSATFQLDKNNLLIDLSSVFVMAKKANEALSLYATFDASCPDVAFTDDVDMEFTVKYVDGFRPSGVCKSQRTCNDCKSQGCAWCTWSERPHTDVEDYLPDWDFVEAARDDRRGQCGVNSGVCDSTDGRVNFCDASAAHARLAALAAALLPAFLHFY